MLTTIPAGLEREFTRQPVSLRQRQLLRLVMPWVCQDFGMRPREMTDGKSGKSLSIVVEVVRAKQSASALCPVRKLLRKARRQAPPQ